MRHPRTASAATIKIPASALSSATRVSCGVVMLVTLAAAVSTRWSIIQAAVPPVATNVVVTTQEGVPGSGVLTATDGDGDPLTFSIVTGPTKGTLTITNPATGAFTYTPNAGTVGYDAFTFQADDGTDGVSTATGAIFIVADSPRWPGQTIRASVNSDGTEFTVPSSLLATPSADGRLIAFTSGTVGGDPGSLDVHVFVHDRLTGATTMESVYGPGHTPIGGALARMSPDGRYLAFTSLSSGVPGGHPDATLDVFLRDREAQQTERINVATDGTPANGESVLPVSSADGRYVAFYSTATNLVAADTDDNEDVYVRDRQTEQTRLVSVNSSGVKGNSDSWFPTMSADGRFIAFNSEASNLVPGDTNGEIDVFVRDLQTGQTTRVSVASGGGQGNGNTQGLLSVGGRFVVLESSATNLVTGDTNGFNDVFIHDRQTGQTTLVSVSSAAAQGNGDSEGASLSADGRYVVFRSAASNLVPDDTNGVIDEFVHDRQTGRTVRINVASDGTQANAASLGIDDDGCCVSPSISADGRSIVFHSPASNLVPSDTNGLDDVLVVGPVRVSPTALDAPGEGGPQNVQVEFDYPGTPWSASTTATWITVSPPGGGTANGTVTFTVAPNTGLERTGRVVVALQAVTVNQDETASPQPPTGLYASSIAGNLLTLRFTPPAAGPTPTGYVLEGGINPGETVARIPTGSTQPLFAIAAPTGAFYVRMRTATGAGTSGPSNEVRVLINSPAAPSAPTNLQATVNGSGLALAWTNTAAGGTATSMILDVTGSFTGSLPLRPGEVASFGGVPAGTYTLALRAANASGASGPSNAVTVTLPGACTGAPLTPTNFLTVKSGNRLSLYWDLAGSGPAPTGYLIDVTGAFVGTVPVAARSISAGVGRGTYNLSVRATNACGTSDPTAVQAVTIP